MSRSPSVPFPPEKNWTLFFIIILLIILTWIRFLLLRYIYCSLISYLLELLFGLRWDLSDLAELLCLLDVFCFFCVLFFFFSICCRLLLNLYLYAFYVPPCVKWKWRWWMQGRPVSRASSLLLLLISEGWLCKKCCDGDTTYSWCFPGWFPPPNDWCPVDVFLLCSSQMLGKIRSVCVPVKRLRHFLVSFHVHQCIQTLPWSVCVQLTGVSGPWPLGRDITSVSLSSISEIPSSLSTLTRWRLVSPAQMQSLLQSNTQSHLTFAGRRQVQTNTSVCVCACACIMRRSSVSCCPPNVFWLVWENLCRLTCSAAQPGCLSRWAENQDVSKGHCSSPWHPHHHSTHPSTALASRGAQQQARIRLDFTGAGSQGSLLTFFLFLQERKCVNWWMKSLKKTQTQPK